MNAMSALGLRVLRSGLCGPSIALLGTLWLLHHLLTSRLYAFHGVHTGYGPLSWPEFSLIMLIVSIGLLCGARCWTCIRRRSLEGSSTGETATCDNVKVTIGGWFILLYGLGFIFMGFLFSSVLFLAAWMIYGGMRSPLKIASLSLLGVITPLYLLVKLAYMPLPRGVGIFEAATVHIYQWLGVF
jgi:putative tricarboxylic transport membrane protein